MRDEPVLCEIRGGVACITLNRPEHYNAWTYEMEELYFETLDRLAADPLVRAAVLTGAGRSFCPGLDKDLLSQDAAGTIVKPAKRLPMAHPLSFPKPLVAAIGGPCAGVGLIQALVCDVRFAAEGASFATGFVRRGLVAEHAISWLLVRVAGHANAMELLLSGRKFSGTEAAELGVVHRVVPDRDLRGAAIAYASEIATWCAPRSLAAIKAQVWDDWLRTREASAAEGRRLLDEPERKEDLAEGVASLLEKRPPAFAPLPWPPAR
jgi:enoyl-CoA hydratase/carnithine racemase